MLQIARTLLRHGANVELRDEHGLTALEKARERSEDGHREVVALLERPQAAFDVNVNMVAVVATPLEKIGQARRPSTASTDTIKPGFVMDEAVADACLKCLLPIFCRLFHQSVLASVRRTALSLVRKATMNISAG